MQTRLLLAGAALVVITGPSCATRPSAAPAAASAAPPAAAAAAATRARAPGYLAKAHMPEAGAVLGPPPAEGSGSMAGDLQTFQATRRLQGSARWALATRDADYGADAMLRDFSCAVGVVLTQASAPHLHHLMSRLVTDASGVEYAAKDVYKRPRPFVTHGGQICVPDDGGLRKSYSYPSGHSTYGWLAGLVLAQIAPDEANAVLARARSYGDSRVVCGVHYVSDVQAGRSAAALVFGVLQDEPDYRTDLELARQELASLRAGAGKAPPDAAECALEADAAATPVW